MVAVSLALVLMPAAAADARRAALCTHKGGKTLLATRDARVFAKHGQAYACLRRSRRAFRLGSHSGEVFGHDRSTSFRLRGRFVAYSLARSFGLRVRVRDLRRGRMLHDVAALTTPTRPFEYLTDLRLKRNGSVAWIVRADSIDAVMTPQAMPTDFLPYYEVARSDRGGRGLLDRGHDIAGGSLALRGSVIRWLKAGRPRAAILN